VSRPGDKYRYQETLWGRAGQAGVRAGRVGIFGLGATGAAHAHILARAGVGFLRLVDRDIVEAGDLHRSQLFDEKDAACPTAKAAAAARRIREVNADVTTETAVAFVTAANVSRLAADLDVLVDGADNYPLRFLLNDVAVKTARPLIYQGALGARGAAMAVVPGLGPCFRCLLPEPPPPASSPTCTQLGVSPAAAAATAAVGAALTLAVLRGEAAAVAGALTRLEDGGYVTTVRVPRRPDCPTCVKGEYPFIAGAFTPAVNRVCGGLAFEVFPRGPGQVALAELAARHAGRAELRDDGLILDIVDGETSAVVFGDGRALIYGGRDEEHAQAIYDRLVGQ